MKLKNKVKDVVQDDIYKYTMDSYKKLLDDVRPELKKVRSLMKLILRF